jgi:hypothetical protein
MDFDETRLYYSHQNLQAERVDDDGDADPDNNHGDGQIRRSEYDDDEDDEDNVDLQAVRRHFREFLSAYFRHGSLSFVTNRFVSEYSTPTDGSPL